MYFSAAAHEVLNSSSLNLTEALPSASQRTAQACGEIAICVDASYGAAVMNQIATELIQKSFDVFVGGEIDAESRAETSALLAFYAADQASTLYLAALLYTCLSKQPIDLQGARQDGLRDNLPSPERLRQLAHFFYERAKALCSQGIFRLEPAAVTGLAGLVVERAFEISSIKDEKKRALEAIWAAAEVQLLLGDSSEIVSLQRNLSNVLPRATMWYLSDERDTVALALEPAFYCAMELSGISKPKLDVFSFYRTGNLANAPKFGQRTVGTQAKFTSR